MLCAEAAGNRGPVAEQLHQVVAPGQQFPIRTGFLRAAEFDVFALSGVELPEDRFHDRHAPCIDLPPRLSLQFSGHPVHHAHVRGDPAARGFRARGPVFEAAARSYDRGWPRSRAAWRRVIPSSTRSR